MKVAIRVDASSQIGTGHFMRCLALADGLRQRNIFIRFVCRHIPEQLRSFLQEKNHDHVLLKPSIAEGSQSDLFHGSWLGTTQAQDAAETIQALSDHIWDWVIVDHYSLDSRWEKELRKIAKKIFVVDDIADRVHDCDFLLDQNLYVDMENRYLQKVPSYCKLLLGPQYALLRQEFAHLHEKVRTRHGRPRKILVFFGGVDAENYTEHTIRVLSQMNIPDVQIDVVIGGQNPKREMVQSLSKQFGFFCHVQTNRMAELVTEADMGIGAGGTAVWERCCLGLPTLTISLAHNQRDLTVNAAKKGLLYSPDRESTSDYFLENHIKALFENSALREHLSENSMKAVDGLGVLRVVKRIICSDLISGPDSSLGVRLAVVEDGARTWKWRNSKKVRENSFDPTPISMDDHLTWWKEALSNPARTLLIAQFQGTDVGVLRLDFEKDQAIVSVYLDSDFTGIGLGSSLLRLGNSWLLENRPQVNTVLAKILPENEASIQAFEAAGFRLNHLVFSWSPKNRGNQDMTI